MSDLIVSNLLVRRFGMSEDDAGVLWQHMRTPVRSFVMLLFFLGVTVLCGATLPVRWIWMVEALSTLCMVVIVLVVSMELTHEPPLIRLFAVVGFFWVTILFGMTLGDYLFR